MDKQDIYVAKSLGISKNRQDYINNFVYILYKENDNPCFVLKEINSKFEKAEAMYASYILGAWVYFKQHED